MQKQILFKDRTLSYRLQGQGPCLLLQHGFCEDSTMWEDFTAFFAKNYSVLRPDLPGFGGSEVLNPISIDEMAEAVNAILEAEEIETCVFVGHSMGGYVAMAFAAKYSEKLKALGLFHSHPFADTEDKKQNREKTIGFMERWGSVAFVKELVPKLFSQKFATEQADFVETYTAHATTFEQEGLIAATRAMIMRSDRADVLEKLDCPVLFIIGALDEAIPKEFSMRQTELPKQATAYVLEVAHMGMFEAKQHTLDMLDLFLEELYL